MPGPTVNLSPAKLGVMPGGGGTFLFCYDANDAMFPAANPAAATSRNGHPLLAFDDTTAESIIFPGVLSSDYQGGDATAHIDWVAATAVVGGVAWGGEIERIAPGGQDIDADGFARSADRGKHHQRHQRGRH